MKQYIHYDIVPTITIPIGIVKRDRYPIYTEHIWTRIHQDNRNLYSCYHQNLQQIKSPFDDL
jgi:hypothetical protein